MNEVLQYFSCIIQKISLSGLLSVLDLVLTTVIAFCAWKALKTWKWQISHKMIFDTAIAYEKELVRFLVLSSVQSNLAGNELLVDIGNSIQESRFALRLREFEPEHLKTLEVTMRNCIKDLKDSNVVSPESHEALRIALNCFSAALNQHFLGRKT